MYLSHVIYCPRDAVQLPEAVTHPSVSVPGHLPGLDPGGHWICDILNISRPVTARRTQATSINPTMRTSAYTKKFATNPANVFALDAAKNAVPVHRPSIKPAPFFGAISLNARKRLLSV
jgi:hypothetical protein